MASSGQVILLDFTLDEILKAITSFKKNKCPGRDGLSAEFYFKFSVELAPFKAIVYNQLPKQKTSQ